MAELTLRRRGFLAGVAGLLVSPAIVRADALMPISTAHLRPDYFIADFFDFANQIGVAVRMPNGHGHAVRRVLEPGEYEALRGITGRKLFSPRDLPADCVSALNDWARNRWPQLPARAHG